MNITVEKIERTAKVNVITKNVIVSKPENNIVVNRVGRKGEKGDPGDPATNLVTSVNGKQGVVVLNANDVGADPTGSASQALSDANDYTDQEIAGVDTGVVSVQAGANVSVDNTDPKNPIVSSTGGGGVSEWGDIDGTLSDQTDLQNALNAKADTSSLGSAAYGDVVQGLGASTADVISQDAFTTILGQTVLSVNEILLNKVDKVTGKGLSTNDYTDTDRDKLAGIEEGAQVNAVTSVASKTGAVTLAKADVGLGNVDNTSDANKPISTATQNALDDKVGSDTSVSQVIALTQAEYDAIVTKDPTTLYFIKDL